MNRVVENGQKQGHFTSSEHKAHSSVHFSFLEETGPEVLSADTIMMTLRNEA